MIKLEKLKKSVNIAELLDEDELSKISEQVLTGYELDRESRSEWEDVINKSLEIAKQTLNSKNYPWPNASNIKFPLITKASIDFAARMLPEIIKNDKIVKVSVTGSDPDNLIARRAQRVQEHMCYQLLKQSNDWVDGMDSLLTVLSIMGTAFKKTYYDPFKKRPVSELCLPEKIVVNYNTQSLEKCRRITHEFTFYLNDIIERIRAGLYCDVDLEHLQTGSEYAEDLYDPPMELLEQHCWLDLDGDNYKEPYIVVVHKASRQVLRIVNRFGYITKNSDGKIKCIEPIEYFTDYHFLKSPDGGFYSLGFGVLLYPLNSGINTLLNQLIDSGTLHNQQSGIIGRGLRIKGGEFKVGLGEWKIADSAVGTSIKDNVVPLPTKEPSPVLFQLLEFLTQVGKDLTSTNEALEGTIPAQNVAATTMLTLVEQGMKVPNSITSRIQRALKKEFYKIFLLNRQYLSDKEYQEVLNDPRVSVKADYEIDSYDILPIAEPNMASDAQRNAKAQALMSLPGLNPYEQMKYYLESLQFDQKLIDKLLPKPDPNAPPPPEAQKMMAEVEKLKAQAQAELAAAQDLSNKNQLEMQRLAIQKQLADAQSSESSMRIYKMEKDTEHGEMKLSLAGAKADHDAQLKEADQLRKQALDQANVTLKSMDSMSKATEVKHKVEKDDVEVKLSAADRLLKNKELDIKAKEATRDRKDKSE